MSASVRLTDDLIVRAFRQRMDQATSDLLLQRIVDGAVASPRPRTIQRRRGAWPLSWGPPAAAVAAALAVVLGIAIVGSILRPGPVGPEASPAPSPSGPTASPPSSPAVSPRVTPEALQLGDTSAERLRLGTDVAPIDVTAAFDSIWTADIHARAVSRFDPTTFEETARIPVDAGAAWFVEADGALWVTAQLGIGILRVDPATNTVVARVGGAPPCGDAVVADGDIWYSACDAAEYFRIDPATNTVADIVAARGYGWIVLAAGRLVVLGEAGLAVFDPADETFTTIGTGIGAGGTVLGSDGSTVWIVAGDGVKRIDPADGRVVASFAYPRAKAISFEGGHAWLSVEDLGVIQIDLATNAIGPTIAVPSPDIPLEAFGALWVTDFESSELWRIGL